MSVVPVDVVVHFTDEKRRLLLDLLHAHILNLEGHKETIASIPELAVVAQEGYAKIDEQISLARTTAEMLQ